MTTTKIVDTTVISANLNEIRCNFLNKCSQEYTVVTSSDVYTELKNFFEDDELEEGYSFISIKYPTETQSYEMLMEYLGDRYPYLHKGELSSFLLAILEYELKDRRYYYITDDNKVKKIILKIHEDELFMNKVGTKLSKINVTGTLGLIKQLYHKGILSNKELKDIISDLKNSTFFISPYLIDYLGG